MEIMLWILGIHFIEVIFVLGFLLIKKNKKLEQVVLEQQQYIDVFSSIIENSNNRLKEIDTKGTFESDDEIGWFFEQIKEIQNILNDFKVSRK
jgi:hypothetical protein